MRRSTGKTRSMYQPSASGSASSRSVSAVGAQSTTMTSHAADSAWLRSSSSASTSSAPGSTVSSSAVIGSTPGRVEHREQVALDLAPGLLEPPLGVDLLDVQPRRHLGRLGARPGSPKASASECAASVDRTSVRGPRAAAQRRRAGGGGRLADAALAGEEEIRTGPTSSRAVRGTRRAS